MTVLAPNDIRQLLAAKCKEAGSQRAWAKQHGFSGQYINDVVRGRRNADADALLNALGLEKRFCPVSRAD